MNTQNFQILDILTSSYYSSFLSSQIENFATYLFDSVLSGLETNTQNDFFRNNIYTLDSDNTYRQNFDSMLPTFPNKVLFGTNGDDVLNGCNGNDVISGANGNDILNGGGGNDIIYGISNLNSASSNAASITLRTTDTFDVDDEGYTYFDNYFGISSGGGAYSSGAYDGTTGDDANGALNILLGGIDGTTQTQMSASYGEVFNKVSASSTITLEFSYRILHAGEFDAGENILMGYGLNAGGVTLVTVSGGVGIDQDTGWVTRTVNLGSIAAGNHTIFLGGRLTGKSDALEQTSIWFDDVSFIEVAATVPTTDTNSLSGGDGLDILYGSTETDIFIFEAISAYNDIDEVNNFNAPEGDALDISDLLVGFIPGPSDINDFIQFIDSGSDTIVQIDSDGTVGGASFTTVAQINDLTGINADDLYAAGNIIV